MDVGRGDGGHLAALHLGDAALGIEDEDVDGVAVAAGLDGRRAGVARGGADDGDAPAPLLQRMVEERAEQLQGIVLEGERGPVEQLQQPDSGPSCFSGATAA